MRNAADKPVDAQQAIPFSLRVAAAIGWRFLVLAGVVWVLGKVFDDLRVVVVPVGVALLLSALLAPAVDRLVAWRVPRGLATVLVLVGGLAVVGGVLTFVINAFIRGLPDMRERVTESISTIQDWLKNNLHLTQDQLSGYVEKFLESLKSNQEAITSGALTTAGTVGELLTGMLLALFTLIFFLYDGRGIWAFLVRLLPGHVRARTAVAGSRGFASLVGYVRATAVVAVVDAVGIGIGLWAIGIPLAVPLAALVFLGGFVPIVGALISGSVAVLVALVTKGIVPALLVLAVVLAVQQLEGHVLQPLLLGRAVQLHPLAVVLGIAVGASLAGIAGALLSVPLIAVSNAVVRSLVADEGTLPSQVDALEPEEAEPDEPAEASGPPGGGRTSRHSSSGSD
ncbi:AI-2E family transporter [Streptoalloteichus tenebrarius]|uniref:AI-2E family transporter n=1 Tax=Streptoalloteichus tenebrarius (strain ATCC 17920 / DSM 40477 / JCM 4838 / CBS 697.72 / NBRC 16177 / NCIMB 11028 / NRRL B-12390 / A12253. 1 / ISP 5477) TaxID=1933 RepID=UPI0020A57D78|nr:AI-2E family transporter [Streptoalloteichus tenebrarius]BFF02009.1 AI-2E family transporter [Streptoalloteichus tenebrarius]